MRMGKQWQMEHPWYLIHLLFASGGIVEVEKLCNKTRGPLEHKYKWFFTVMGSP